MISKIRENLYLGDDSSSMYFDSSGTPAMLIDLRGWKFDMENSVNWDSIPIEDWYEVISFVEIIKTSINSGFPTLVFCHGGIDKSPFVVACYLHLEEHMNAKDAYKEVKELHPQTIIHDDWMTWFSE